MPMTVIQEPTRSNPWGTGLAAGLQAMAKGFVRRDERKQEKQLALDMNPELRSKVNLHNAIKGGVRDLEPGKFDNILQEAILFGGIDPKEGLLYEYKQTSDPEARESILDELHLLKTSMTKEGVVKQARDVSEARTEGTIKARRGKLKDLQEVAKGLAKTSAQAKIDVETDRKNVDKKIAANKLITEASILNTTKAKIKALPEIEKLAKEMQDIELRVELSDEVIEKKAAAETEMRKALAKEDPKVIASLLKNSLDLLDTGWRISDDEKNSRGFDSYKNVVELMWAKYGIDMPDISGVWKPTWSLGGTAGDSAGYPVIGGKPGGGKDGDDGDEKPAKILKEVPEGFTDITDQL